MPTKMDGGIAVTNANLTPHIACAPEDFAKTVLMPGDPLRAKFIAETYLTDRELSIISAACRAIPAILRVSACP